MRIQTGSNLIMEYILVLLACAILFIATCAPGIVWQDSGLIQYRVLQNDIEGNLGLALSHPLYYIIAMAVRGITLDELAYRINVLNAVISAIAVANLFLLLRLWLGETFAAWLGAATLALSHTFWLHAAMPETYNLIIALLMLEMVMLVQYAKTSSKKYLYILAFINGLAIANHMLASIAFICYLVLLLFFLKDRKITARNIFVMALLWIFGALPYEFLIIKNIFQTGDLSGTLSSAVFGTMWRNDVLNTSISLTILKENLMYFLLNFPSPNIVLCFFGIWVLYRLAPKRWFANTLTAMLVLFFVFAFRYTVTDRFCFFIPFYSIIAILIALGAHQYLSSHKSSVGYLFALFCLIPIPVYIIAPKIAQGLEIKIGSGRVIPHRDDDTYFLRPWKTGDDGAELFGTQALYSVQLPAIIYADATTAPPLLYIQRIGKPQVDVDIISSLNSGQNTTDFNEQTIETLLTQKSVYVVSPVRNYCPDFLVKYYDFEFNGILWKVVGKKPGL